MSHWSRRGAGALWLVAGLLAIPSSLQAAELALSGEEVANLGITLAAPELAEVTRAVPARGRVVIPPAGDVAVSPAHEGLVVRLLRASGDRVAAGELLAEINSPVFLESQRGFLDAATADELARQRLARDRQLAAEGIVSRRRLEETGAEAAAAAAAFAEHRQMLRIAGLDDAAIDALAKDRRLLPLLPVRAPLDGTVLDSAARVGSGVSPTEALFRIGDVSTLWLELELAQRHLGDVAPGMTVSVDGAGAAIARVLAIGGAVHPETQMVTVRAELEGGSHGLRPGQFVAVRIAGDTASGSAADVWSVPAASVVQAGDGHFVFLRTASGFRVAPVRQVGADGDRALVAAEFGAGARLAHDGVSALKSLWGGPADGDS
ncbi:MAG: hypothetical protein CMQ43_09505 [Gammaproteobacteria bacterium]|nr:hypothetical protein [Gammaproteobacteria bacterium]